MRSSAPSPEGKPKIALLFSSPYFLAGLLLPAIPWVRAAIPGYSAKKERVFEAGSERPAGEDAGQLVVMVFLLTGWEIWT